MTTIKVSPMLKLRMKRFLAHHRQFWRLYLRNVCIVVGFSLVSVCIVCLNEDYPSWVRSFFRPKIDIKGLSQEYKDETSVYVDTKVADALFHKVPILCYILSTKSQINNKIQAVNNTWARRCNKVLYVMCYDKEAHDVLSSCEVGESKYHLTAKVRYALKHIYKNYYYKYDWFLKADDDTYMIMENLRYMLSHYPVDKPGYLGYHFNMHLKQGYMSGGAGYVINRQALKLVNERAFKEGGCREEHKDEDMEIGKCLQYSGVSVFSSLDKFDRETFHTDRPWQHVKGTFPSYLNYYSKNTPKLGLGCCSQFAVSYHHLDPRNILVMEHMLYRTSVYGRHGSINVTDMFKPKIILP